MLDIRTDLDTAAAAPTVIRREDHRAPDWLVPEVELAFDLDPARTISTLR